MLDDLDQGKAGSILGSVIEYTADDYGVHGCFLEPISAAAGSDMLIRR